MSDSFVEILSILYVSYCFRIHYALLSLDIFSGIVTFMLVHEYAIVYSTFNYSSQNTIENAT